MHYCRSLNESIFKVFKQIEQIGDIVMQSLELTIRKVPAITPTTSLQEAGVVMQKAEVGLLPVFDDGHLMGTVSERDLAIHGCGAGFDPRGVDVSQVMNRNVAVCMVHSDLKFAIQLMRTNNQIGLIVLDTAGCLMGLVSLFDLLDIFEGLVPERSEGPMPESVLRVRGVASAVST